MAVNGTLNLPAVSVVLPTYQRRICCARAVASVHAQTGQRLGADHYR